MKKFLLLTLVLTVNFYVFGKDKKTIIDRINDAKIIPVYVLLGDVKAEKYNEDFGKVPLNQYELGRSFVAGVMPTAIDSLKDDVISQLKHEFNNDKFTFVRSAPKEEIKKEIHEKQLGFVVIIDFSASYGYEYIKVKPRRESDEMNSYLVTSRKLKGVCGVGFYQANEKNIEFKKLKRQGSFVYDNNFFEEKGLNNNARVLMKKRDPLILKEKMVYQLNENVIKLVTSLKKKHDKVLAKRKK